MQVNTRVYRAKQGWDSPLPANLDSSRTLLVVFAAAELFEAEIDWLAQIRNALPQSQMIGCSTTMPLVNGQLLPGSAVLAVCQLEHARIKLTSQPLESPADSLAAGQAIGRALYQPDLRQIMLFADGRTVNANELMNGINSVAPQAIRLSGGMASHPDFNNGLRLLILDGTLKSQTVVAAALYGDQLMIQQREDVGLKTYSQYYEVTRHGDRLITEVNGRPALDVYNEFLGELADDKGYIHMFPIGFYEAPDTPMKVVRSILDLSQGDRALILASEVPAHPYMRFMTGLPSQFIDSAQKVAAGISASVINERFTLPLLSLTTTCVGRQAAMGRQAEQEVARAFAALPRGTEQIGFAAYGEIAWSSTGFCELHNHTINIMLMGERPTGA